MPQLLNHLKVDTTDASIDWGTVAIYTCADSCDQDTNILPSSSGNKTFQEIKLCRIGLVKLTIILFIIMHEKTHLKY